MRVSAQARQSMISIDPHGADRRNKVCGPLLSTPPPPLQKANSVPPRLKYFSCRTCRYRLISHKLYRLVINRLSIDDTQNVTPPVLAQPPTMRASGGVLLFVPPKKRLMISFIWHCRRRKTASLHGMTPCLGLKLCAVNFPAH